MVARFKSKKLPNTDKGIRALATPPWPKRYELADGSCQGLRLLVLYSGAKSWRFRYGEPQRLKTLGKFPSMGIRQAREAADACRENVEQGLPPVGQAASQTFLKAAESYLSAAHLTGSSAATARRALQNAKDLHPVHIEKITGARIFEVLRKLEGKGQLETVRKLKYFVSKVMTHSVAMGWRNDNPVPALPKIKTPQNVAGFPALTDPKAVGRLMRGLDGYQGSEVVGFAMRILAHVFTRPTELRLARWGEFDLENSTWTIPADRMKGGRAHVVPLSKQVAAMLADLQTLTDDGPESWCFPGMGSKGRTISENTINNALRALGYDTKTTHSAHGFRKTASTLLNAARQDSEAIELQLAHTGMDRMRRVYNKDTMLETRVELMQFYSDLLDKLKNADAASVPDESEALPEWLAA